MIRPSLLSDRSFFCPAPPGPVVAGVAGSAGGPRHSADPLMGMAAGRRPLASGLGID